MNYKSMKLDVQEKYISTCGETFDFESSSKCFNYTKVFESSLMNLSAFSVVEELHFLGERCTGCWVSSWPTEFSSVGTVMSREKKMGSSLKGCKSFLWQVAKTLR